MLTCLLVCGELAGLPVPGLWGVCTCLLGDLAPQGPGMTRVAQSPGCVKSWIATWGVQGNLWQQALVGRFCGGGPSTLIRGSPLGWVQAPGGSTAWVQGRWGPALTCTLGSQCVCRCLGRALPTWFLWGCAAHLTSLGRVLCTCSPSQLLHNEAAMPTLQEAACNCRLHACLGPAAAV